MVSQIAHTRPKNVAPAAEGGTCARSAHHRMVCIPIFPQFYKLELIK
jgi:hypothetical protein